MKAFQLLLPSVFFCSKRQNACVTLHFGSYFRLGLFFPASEEQRVKFSDGGDAFFMERRSDFFGGEETSQS